MGMFKWFSISAGFILFTFIGFLLGVADEKSREKFDFNKFLEEFGAREALRLVQMTDHEQFQEIVGKNMRDLYVTRGWSHYRNGDLETARRLGHQILVEQGTNKSTGDGYYLLGEIESATAQGELSLAYFNKAYMLYNESELPTEMYLASLGRAKAFMRLGRLGESEKAFSIAMAILPKANQEYADIVHYYLLYTELSARTGDYTEGLKMAQLAYDSVKGTAKRESLAEALMTLGLFYTLVGDYERGLAQTLDAERLIHELGDEKKLMYNLVNSILADRCLGSDASPEIEEIENWATMNSDEIILFYLNLAKSHCAGEPE